MQWNCQKEEKKKTERTHTPATQYCINVIQCEITLVSASK